MPVVGTKAKFEEPGQSVRSALYSGPLKRRSVRHPPRCPAPPLRLGNPRQEQMRGAILAGANQRRSFRGGYRQFAHTLSSVPFHPMPYKTGRQGHCRRATRPEARQNHSRAAGAGPRRIDAYRSRSHGIQASNRARVSHRVVRGRVSGRARTWHSLRPACRILVQAPEGLTRACAPTKQGRVSRSFFRG